MGGGGGWRLMYSQAQYSKFVQQRWILHTCAHAQAMHIVDFKSRKCITWQMSGCTMKTQLGQRQKSNKVS